MSVFESREFDHHQEVHFYCDNASGLKALIALHSLGQRRIALGGCRYHAYDDEQAAVDDCLRLARSMTFKSAMIRAPFGGGKAVILASAAEKTPDMMRAMGRFIDSLQGRFMTGEDIGMTKTDVQTMAEETKHLVGIREGTEEPSVVAAYGVFHGIRAAVQHKLGRTSLRGVKVAVQGTGKVGAELCRLLAEAGARLWICDPNVDRLQELQQRFAARPVALEAIYEQPADVFAPCALGSILNSKTVPKLKAPIVAGSANNQLASVDIGRLLDQRGILYAPDYVINAGGLINVAWEVLGYDRNAVMHQAEGIYDTLIEVFQRAVERSIPPTDAANQLALERSRDNH